MKDVTPEQRETLDKMIERLEEFDDVQTVYTNMKPEGGEMCIRDRHGTGN